MEETAKCGTTTYRAALVTVIVKGKMTVGTGVLPLRETYESVWTSQRFLVLCRPYGCSQPLACSFYLTGR